MVLFTCKCGTLFRSKKSIEDHMRRCEKLENVAVPPLHHCFYCYVPFPTKKEQENHMKICENNPESETCDSCKRSFSTRRSFNIHLKTCPGNTLKGICRFCKKTVSDKGIHEISCYKNPDQYENMCHLCGATPLDLESHRKRCQENHCIFCEKHVWKHNMDLHLEKCDMNPDRKCRYCSKVMPKGEFESHKRNCRESSVFRVISEQSSLINISNGIGIQINDAGAIPAQYFNVPTRERKKEKKNKIKMMEEMLEKQQETFEKILEEKGMSLEEISKEKDLTCPICYNLTMDKTPCGHSLCIMCKDKVDKCPLCRQAL